LTGERDTAREHGSTPRIDWVIAGGESGQRRQAVRPMHPDWVRSLRDQCAAAGVPFHFKQWGAYAPANNHALKKDRICVQRDGGQQWIPSIAGVVMDRFGAKRAGRELDGRTWDEFPAAAELTHGVNL
jgi:protein gp37